MARKPSDVTQVKIRVREDLRRQLEQAAKKRDVSINFEMTDRLKASFDLPPLSKITADLENVYERYAREGRDQSQTQELMRAAEHLITLTQLPTEVQDREAVNRAIAWVQEAIEAIARVHGRIPTHEPE